jgi:hypothetical protein
LFKEISIISAGKISHGMRYIKYQADQITGDIEYHEAIIFWFANWED